MTTGVSPIKNRNELIRDIYDLDDEKSTPSLTPPTVPAEPSPQPPSSPAKRLIAEVINDGKKVLRNTTKRKIEKMSDGSPSKRLKRTVTSGDTRHSAVDLTTPDKPVSSSTTVPYTPPDGSSYEDGKADEELRRRSVKYDDTVDMTKDEVMAKLLTKRSGLSRGAGRYFMGGDGDPMASVKCHNCAKRGHYARDCPNSTHNTCFVCGSKEHSSWDCMEDPCDLCLQTGHDSSECMNEPVGLKLCTFCGSRDHFIVNCPGEMSPSNEKLRCMVCYKAGHLNCVGPRKAKSVQWCCQCASKSHTIEHCRNLPMSAEDISGGFHGGRPRFSRQYKTCYHCASLRHIARNCPQQPPRTHRWQSGYRRYEPSHRGYRRFDSRYEHESGRYQSRSSSLASSRSNNDRWQRGGFSSTSGSGSRSDSSGRHKRSRNERQQLGTNGHRSRKGEGL